MSRKNKHDHLSRFQELLREIFQFDFADLDTGIYRLFRLREKELCRFIEEALPAEVDAAFGADTSEQRQLAQEKVDELADRLREELADDAVQPTGNLSAEYNTCRLQARPGGCCELTIHQNEFAGWQAEIA